MKEANPIMPKARRGALAVGAAALLLASFGVGIATAADVDKVQVGDTNTIFPESMGGFPDGTLFVGGTGTGILYRAKPGETKATALSKPPNSDPKSLFGVYADKTYSNVWGCFSKGGKGPNPPAVLRQFDPNSGAVKGTFPLGDGSFCNDITSTRDGTLFVSDTSNGRVMRLGPGGYKLEEWFKDPQLAGVDGISLGSDGNIYLNSVSSGKLFRLELKDDTTAGALTELKLSQPLMGPDGMRFGKDGKLYLAENKAGQIDQITIDGDNANVKVIKTGYDTPTGISPMSDKVWISEEKAGARRANTDPVNFFMYRLDPSAPAQ